MMSGPSPPPIQQTYQPPGQSQVANQYLQQSSQMQPYVAQTMGDVIPGYENMFNSYANNPYFSSYMGAANNAAGMAGSTVAPMQFGGAGSMYNLGNMAGGMAGSQGGVLGSAPGVLGGLNYASPLLSQNAGAAQPLYGNLGASNNFLSGASNLYAGMQPMANMFAGEAAAAPAQNNFDPTGAIYNRDYSRMMDQTNAINSMYGVAGSPYGAGVAAQNANNFNMDWENQQQQRDLLQQQITGAGIGNQLQAASGYGNIFNSGLSGYSGTLNPTVSAISGLTGTGVGAYGDILGSTTGAYGGLVNPAVNTFTGLGSLAGSQYGGASDLGLSGLNTMTQQGSIPYNAYSGQLSQMLNALNAYSGGAGAAMAPGNSLMASLGNYLGIGQNAAAQQNAAQQAQYQAQLQANSAMWGGIGSMFGSAAGLYAMSDRRAKDNIRRIGRTPRLGIPVYRFTYKGSNKPQTGVMADEVERLIPAAVMTGFDGFKRVDYSMVA